MCHSGGFSTLTALAILAITKQMRTSAILLCAFLLAGAAHGGQWTFDPVSERLSHSSSGWTLEAFAAGMDLTINSVLLSPASPAALPLNDAINGGYQIVSIDHLAFRNCDSLTEVSFGNSVATIGLWSFYNCRNLAELSFGDAVADIGEYAFFYCDNLTNISVSAANPLYCSIDGILFSKDGTALLMYPQGRNGAFEIPDSVTSIGNNAFSNCNGIADMTIPNSVTNIGEYAFSECGALTNIVLGSGVTNISLGTFYGSSSLNSISMPTDNPIYCSIDGVVFSKDGAQLFLYPTGKKGAYEIPSCVTNIGERAFSDCESLTSVLIPDSVANIGMHAFNDCDSLANVTFGAGVSSIGSRAFAYCGSLTKIALPSSVASIGLGAFENCAGLTSISVSANNSAYCDIDGVLFNRDATTLIFCPAGLAGVYEIPNNVTTISNYAFRYCRNLIRVTIPNSVARIGDYAFDSCESLTDIVLGSGIAEIGAGAFYYCRSLIEVLFKGECPLFTGGEYDSIFDGYNYTTVFISQAHIADWESNLDSGSFATGDAIWQRQPVRILETDYVSTVTTHALSTSFLCEDGVADMECVAKIPSGAVRLLIKIRTQGSASFSMYIRNDEPPPFPGYNYRYTFFGKEAHSLTVIPQPISGDWRILISYYENTQIWSFETDADTPGTVFLSVSYDMPRSGSTCTTLAPTPVPHGWLDMHGLVANNDYESAAAADSDGDGHAAWEEYVANTDPTDSNSVLRTNIRMENGAPVVTWTPHFKTHRIYSLESATDLTSADWLPHANENNNNPPSASRFFRVKTSLLPPLAL